MKTKLSISGAELRDKRKWEAAAKAEGISLSAWVVKRLNNNSTGEQSRSANLTDKSALQVRSLGGSLLQ